jgi:hypothetical protein
MMDSPRGDAHADREVPVVRVPKHDGVNLPIDLPIGTRSRSTSSIGSLAFVLFALAGIVGADVLVAQDRMRTLVWVTGPLVVGLASSLAKTGLGTPRWRRVCIGASATVLALVAAYMQFGTSRQDLRKEGDRIVAALESYRAVKDAYPVRLEDAGVRPAWNRFGGWEYESRDDGRHWSLSVGDYMSDGFVLYRSSERPDWSVDD